MRQSMISRIVVLTALAAAACQVACGQGKVADKPLFRDPVEDGAADPVVIWNRGTQSWYMLYTNRRAKAQDARGVEWVHGTRIGIAESTDGGASWTYKGVADIDLGGDEQTHWAPGVVYHDGLYHMYLTHVPGIFRDWRHPRHIVHLTSDDLVHWTKQSTLKLNSEKVIDAHVSRLPDGTWRMWYNDEPDGKSIYYADSVDLYHWQDRGKAFDRGRCEGPVVFRWHDTWWLLADAWDGLVVYRSDDALGWTRQVGDNLLREPGRGPDDEVKGGHPEVVVSGERAYLFYFTHPGRVAGATGDGYEQRRSSIQVVELQYADGALTCDRDKPTLIDLQPQP